MKNRPWTGDKILQVFEIQSTSFSLKEIAKSLGKTESSIRTSVRLLVQKEFLRREESCKRYFYYLTKKGKCRVKDLLFNVLERQGYKHTYPLSKNKEQWSLLLLRNVCETSVTETAQRLGYSLSTVSGILGCRRKPSQKFINAVYVSLGE